jgi:hypothetical protein
VPRFLRKNRYHPLAVSVYSFNRYAPTPLAKMVAVENKAVLIVIDGYGIPSESSPKEENAIAAAKTSLMDAFSKNAKRH